MDGRRLTVRRPSIKDRFRKMLKKISLGKIFLFIGGAVVVAGFCFLVYYFYEDILLLFPGYYNNREYNSLTADKNDLIDENALLLEKNDALNEEISQLGTSSSDFQSKVDINLEVTENLEKIENNLEKIDEYNEKFTNMRLPLVIERYTKLSAELDDVRKDMISKSKEIVAARIEMDELNKMRAEFDECLGKINWNKPNSEIASSLKTCNQKIDDMQSEIDEMEKDYDVELDQLDNYFKILEEQWTTSVSYHEALAKKNYTEANKFDSIYADKKKIISEMDIAVFNEFNGEAIDHLIDEFEKLAEKEVEKEQEANKWYEDNIRK
ncbi:hypothetical protein JW710_00760 [Candidatus Dojkabacteria bacterium]|nr:hypothetical protein [Candidatus Dojkabacteria bacterium]